PDGSPRTVLSLHSGTSRMVEVVPVKGEPFVVTHDHVLPLVRTNRTSSQTNCGRGNQDGAVDAMTPDEWVSSSKTSRHLHKLYRSRAIGSFDGNDGSLVTVDPYFVGILLGDGGLKYDINVTTAEPEVEGVIREQAAAYGMTLRSEPAGKANTWHMLSGERGCGGGRLHRLLSALGMAGKGSGEKFVPDYYKTLPIGQRLEVVAGLIDTDGCLTCGGYDFISKSRRLSDDLAFMCRSAGLAAYVSESHKKAQSGFSGTYYRVSISGACKTIPCRVARRVAPVRKQKKNVLRTGISSIRNVGYGEYSGFTVDRDNLYLMGDFTVTHNCGKTVIMAEVARRVADRGGRTLLLAHRGELLEQAADKVARATGLSCAVEKAGQTCVGTWNSVTVGSVQTLMRDSRLDALAPDRFDCVMVDEAHHALADGYVKVLDHFAGARVLGVTATPDRGDQRDMGEVFDSLAYEYGLAQAVKDGWLCPIEAQMLPVTLDVSGVAMQSGDYAAGQLGDALDPYLDAIADAMAAEGLRDRHTVVFLPLVRTAKA
ncbi:MAG: DEAD/DEAH box helicase family protein, partial [Atopobiaceae bacterium]